MKLDKAISLFADCYSDELLERVVGEIKYPYSVVGMLEKRLAEKRTANRCIEIYKKIYGMMRLCYFIPTKMRGE